MTYKSMTLKGHNALWNVMFQAISGHISETVRQSPRLLLITDRKWHRPTPFQMMIKTSSLDDLQGQ